jgi:asparagine synthase (glutamine-hydrolysing)
VLPYKYIEDITGVTIDCVRNDIISFLQSFPEQSLEIKYIHFMIYESAFKSVFEGEDRKRFYFWTVTPFYATDFFIKSMSIPEKYKKNYKFYKDFLIKMDKRVADIENAAWGFPISSFKLNLFLYSKNVAKMLPFQIKKYIQADVEKLKKTHHTNLLLFLSELINSEDFPNDFNNKGLSYFKDNISEMNTTVIYKIITPIIVSQLLQKKSNLNTRYANIEFI